jgi:proteasome accessory factor B
MLAAMRKPSRAGSRYAPSQRLDVLRAALVARRMSYADIQELLEASRSTVKRLLAVIGTTDALVEEDIEAEKGKTKKQWRIEPSPRVHATLRLTITQLVALHASRCLVEAFAGTGIKEDLDDVFDKIAATLKKSDVAIAKNLDKKIFVVSAAGRRRYDERIDDVNDAMTALLHEHRVDVRYPGKGGRGERTLRFDPYSILFYKTGIYLAGLSHTHRKVIMLALDSCRGVEWRRGDAFEYPSDYHPARLIEGSFGLMDGSMSGGAPVEVTLRFDAKVARYVERAEWHPSQVCARGEDGSVELRMRVTGTREVVPWVLSFGGAVEVLGPRALREEVGRVLANGAKRYVSD